ncbi:hypothetical protein [Ralstonia insidiosa]|uniref:hypothetical protein n=1 Tax=Ralstonia insidiosa TaxID=190721 RepID=UPI001427BAA0|nr:hypothetical protein [Ralstonia insidiosa]
MADFGAPVAANLKIPDPNQPIQTLSGLMGIQRQKQALQLGQQVLDVGEGEVQQAQQQMKERQILQQTMLTGKDPDGNPIKGQNGEVDPVAMAAFANKHMPLLGQGVQQSLIKTLSDRVALNDSVRGLGQQYRNDISGIVRAGIGSNDPSSVGGGLAAYAQQNPESAPAIGRALSLIQHVNPNMPQAQRDTLFQRLAMEFQPAATTAAQQNPTGAAITGPNGGFQVVQTNPYSAVPMGPVGPETAQGIPLNERQTVSTNQMTGGPVVTTKNGQGVVQGITNAPTQGVYVPQPGDTQDLPVLSGERAAARSQFTGAGLQHTNNQIVLDNIDHVGATGVSGQAFRNIASAFGFNPGDAKDAATAYDLVGKGLERSALQAAQTMGPSTNAGLEAQIKANGSLSYTPQAIKEVTRLNDAIVSGVQAYQPGLERAIAANPSAGVFAKRQFDQQWGANFDPRIFEMYNAAKRGDTATVNSIVSALGGKNSAQFKALMNKAANLNKLSNGEGLQ